LTSFTSDYVQRQTIADRLVGATLEAGFPGIIASSSWKKRCWNILYYGIFYVLREWNVSVSEKYKTLRQLFSMPEYDEYRQSLDYYMENDSAVLRRLLRTGNAAVVIIGWNIIRLRSRLKGSKR